MESDATRGWVMGCQKRWDIVVFVGSPSKFCIHPHPDENRIWSGELRTPFIQLFGNAISILIRPR